jgi:hypothetical protein
VKQQKTPTVSTFAKQKAPKPSGDSNATATTASFDFLVLLSKLFSGRVA